MKAKIFFTICFTATFISIFSQNSEEKNYAQQIAGTDKNIEMVSIKGGTFFMGSPINEKGHLENEGPVHKVKIAPFWMAKYELSWGLYHLFMEREIDNIKATIKKGNEVSQEVDAVSGATTPYTDMSFGMGTEGYPAVSMTHLAASKFCEWLSAMTGNFYRLPTEAEWEYACRAGTQTDYSFGSGSEQLDEYAWSKKNSDGAYKKIGLKKPNAWGLYDMHGNAAEWTLDQFNTNAYLKYSNKTAIDPFEKPIKTYPKVVRGGSWKDDANALRSAYRLPSNKKWKKRDPQIPKSLWWHTDAPFVGFRIIRPLKTPSKEEQKKYWTN